MFGLIARFTTKLTNLSSRPCAFSVCFLCDQLVHCSSSVWSAASTLGASARTAVFFESSSLRTRSRFSLVFGIEVGDQQVSVPVGVMAQQAGEADRAIRLKLPSTYDGSDESWEIFKDDLEGYCGYSQRQMLVFMDDAFEQPNPVNIVDTGGGAELLAATLQHSATLYYLLLSITKDRARKMVKSCPKGNGFEAWRRLSLDKKPRDSGEYTNLLMSLLDASDVPDGPFEERVMDWETKLERYQLVSGDVVSAQHTLGTHTKFLVPPEVKLHLASARLRSTATAWSRTW